MPSPHLHAVPGLGVLTINGRMPHCIANLLISRGVSFFVCLGGHWHSIGCAAALRGAVSLKRNPVAWSVELTSGEVYFNGAKQHVHHAVQALRLDRSGDRCAPTAAASRRADSACPAGANE